MSKLPNIFHNNSKFITNNKNSFSTYNKQKTENNSNVSIDENNLINYFNKKVIIKTINKNEINGVLVSKRNGSILLDTGDSIKIKDIISIK